MIIRPANEKDAAAICAIANTYIRDSAVTFNSIEKTEMMVRDEIAQTHDQKMAFFVAASKGEIVGYASYRPFRSGVGYARTMEHSLAVLPGIQGQGIGRILMKNLEKHAFEARVGSIIGAISAENPKALAFHQALGFVEVGRIPAAGWNFERWIDLILVQKPLLTPQDKS